MGGAYITKDKPELSPQDAALVGAVAQCVCVCVAGEDY